VSAAKTGLQRHYGQWTRLWKAEQKMPVSKSTADQLAVIGQRMGGLDSQTSENLPRGWNILYRLARLDRQTLELLLEQGFIDPKLTLREARALVAEFTGKQTAAEQRKANVRERLRRFEQFVHDTLPGWTAAERKLALATLAELDQRIGQPSASAFGSDLYPKTTKRGSDASVLSVTNSKTDNLNPFRNL